MASGEQMWSGRLLERRALCVGTFELRISRPAVFNFEAGQHITLLVDGAARDYSLVTAPSESTLAVLVRRIPGGRVTMQLDRVPIDTELTFEGPGGRFFFRDDRRPAVMVATGTGIAPFTAMLRAGARPDLLLHGVRTADELYYRKELQAFARQYVPCLSIDSPGPEKAFDGRVTRFLATRPAPLDADFYLAGRIEMIHDVMEIVDARYPSARIFTEAFF